MPTPPLSLPFSAFAFVLGCAVSAAQSVPPSAHRISLTVDVSQPARPISPDLFGIFFEDLNWAADGGLYAELVQNRSFEYHASEQPTWNNLTCWELITRGGGKGRVAIEAADPLHPNNPHYAVLTVTELGAGVGLANAGFDTLPVRAGETYDVSIFAKQPFIGSRWGAPPTGAEAEPKPLLVRLERKDGSVLAEATLPAPGREWSHLQTSLTANASDEAARFVLLATGRGGLAFDVISLFPRGTFRGRRNGLRADLAQTIADLQPRFVRFPGGCLVHGNGLGNMYRWKDTIGPIEQRRAQSNLWGYHQTVGLGYFEYFQFCEDIGAKPLPVVAAAVCCQNSDHTHGMGQKGLPLERMDEYIQEVLDLIEYANGPATSAWGAKRAAAGHPEPFNLEYLGVGNEDRITPVFEERFKLIHDAVKAKHPEITLIGTVGPFPDGEDFDEGWRIANELRVAMVDEHYYRSPEWFWENLRRYDTYDRERSHVYLGEYAAHDDGRRTTLRSALAEAAYLTSLERNGDVVRFASYAPLLGRISRTQWNPNLIYFTATDVYPTVNYHVQQLFSVHAGDEYLTTRASAAPAAFAYSVVRDRTTGDVIVKLVNGAATATSVRLEITGSPALGDSATKIVLTGDPLAVNSAEQPRAVTPQATTISASPTVDLEAPPHSLTILRLLTRR